MAVRDVLGVRKDERVLIVTNPVLDVFSISSALLSSALSQGSRASMIVQPVKGQLDLASDEVMAALRTDPEIIISVSHEKLGKDRHSMKEPIKASGKTYDHYFNYLLGERISRSFWSPSVTLDMFQRTVPLDYQRLKDDCARVKGLLDRGSEVHIKAPSGTDLMIGIRGRKARSDDGDFTERGKGGNLPAGETFISPELLTSKGLIAFDGSISSDKGVIVIKEPIRCQVRDGFVTDISGGEEARKLSDTLLRAGDTTRNFASEGRLPREEMDGYLQNIRNLGELGIGLNRKARIAGNMLEDEKVYGTCHIAIGSNYDDDAKALTHLDGLIQRPTITVMGPSFTEMLMKGGRLLV